MLQNEANIQYLCTPVRVESLRQFDTLSSNIESSTPLTLEAIILGLGTYFFSVNVLPKKKREMRHGMRRPHGVKVRCYADHLIDHDKYLALFPGATLTVKIGMTELNEILLNSMPNSCNKQVHVQVFDCESITF